MHFDKVALDELLAELSELPAEWMDEQAAALVTHIKLSVDALRALGRPVTTDDLAAALREKPEFLDVCRLFLGKGQESVAHMLCGQLGGQHLGWTALRKQAGRDPVKMATALTALDMPAVIDQHLSRRWEAEDILVERYKMSRGRAIAGQHRGRALEDEVAAVLTTAGVPFVPRVTFTGKEGQKAKCDFAIPTKAQPRVVIEAKGFEATGSKLTDFLGDILKIGQAKGYHMYFFLVTDGRGWHNRVSDLRKIVEDHQKGLIDMIYTRHRLGDLAAAVKHIYENE
jgi:hypothetical protein